MEQQQAGAGEVTAPQSATHSTSAQASASTPPGLPYQPSATDGREMSALAATQPPTAPQASQEAAAPPPAPTLSPAKQEEAAAGEFEAECSEALALIDQHIYSREGEYLEKTAHGNVARGWEGFLDTRAGSIQKRRFDDRDRLFSFSSWTFCAANPHMFENTRDEDPDNWCLALRKRAPGNVHPASLERARKKRKT